MRAFSLGWRLAFLAIFAFEAVNAASGIHNVLFAGVERVGLAADINAHQRVFLAVGPGDGLFGFHGGFGQEGEISAVVLENYRTVVRVDVFFHGMSPKNSGVKAGKTARCYRLDAVFASHIRWKRAASAVPAASASSATPRSRSWVICIPTRPQGLMRLKGSRSISTFSATPW